MRTDIPPTPDFERRMEARLRARQTRRRLRFLLPVPVTAVRALRSVGRHAAQLAATASLALLVVFGWHLPTAETASVEIGYTPEIPGYVAQYATAPIDPPSPIERARDEGYEVSVLRAFVPDRAAHGEIIDTRHPGPTSPDSVRGPMLFVIGYSIGSNGANVD